MFKSIGVNTKEKMEMYELLDEIKQFVNESGILSGVLFISVPHTTAGLTMNKNYDLMVQEDIMMKMRDLVPKDSAFRHIEGNSAAHIQASLFGNTLTLILEEGHIELGMFQSVFLCEFDGPRKRKVFFKIIPC